MLILDRMMPEIDGVDLCRRARLLPSFPPLYILMVTSASETADITAGLDAGADDCVVKPFKASRAEGRAQVGIRMVALQESMARRLAELEQALANVKQLRGLLPMCSTARRFAWTTSAGSSSKATCPTIQMPSSATASAPSAFRRCSTAFAIRSSRQVAGSRWHLPPTSYATLQIFFPPSSETSRLRRVA